MCLKTVRNTRYPTPFIQIRILIRNPFMPPPPSVITFLINLLTPPSHFRFSSVSSILSIPPLLLLPHSFSLCPPNLPFLPDEVMIQPLLYMYISEQESIYINKINPVWFLYKIYRYATSVSIYCQCQMSNQTTASCLVSVQDKYYIK